MRSHCELLSFEQGLNPQHMKIDNGALLLFNIKEIFEEAFDIDRFHYLNFNEFIKHQSTYKLVPKSIITSSPKLNDVL